MTANLPLKALPELSNLLDTLHKALTLEMQNYINTKDDQHFKQVINNLGFDLSKFTRSIDAWHNLETTIQQHDQLQEIEMKIDQSRQLLTKAIGLLKL